MNPIQQALDSTAERFEKLWDNFYDGERVVASRYDVMEFIRQEQLAVLEAAREVIKGFYQDDKTKYRDINCDHATYNRALERVLASLDLNKEGV